MIEFFVKHRVTTIMLVLVFVVLGVYSYSNLPVEKTPKMDFPIVTVSIIYPGATPLEVETLVVKKIEDAVSEISEIKKIKSYAYDSLAYTSIEFLIEADVNVKSIEVKDKVDAILNDLPDSIEKPVVEKYDPLIVPVMELMLSSDTVDDRDLYEYADKVLKNKFSSIAGVAKVDLYGGKKRQINAWLDPMLMKQYYISIGEVVNAMLMKNKNIPAGDLEKGFSSLGARFTGEFESIYEIANMKLVSSDGTRFQLKDIAVIEDGYKKIDSMARYNGKNVVGISINKASDGNAISIARQMRSRMDSFREILPQGMKLDIATDTTTFIINETNDTNWSILVGLLLTAAILYFFVGRWDIAVIACIIIPTSIISTLFPMWISKFSINMLTLLAIASVLGTLISNAIVIIENVLVHLERHDDPEMAAIEGTKEVVVPIIAATGTNLVVFMPLSMMGGIVGVFMKSFGLTVIYATVFSILASFCLTPMMCATILRPKAKDKSGTKKSNLFLSRLLLPLHYIRKAIDSIMGFLKKEYKHIFELIFQYPKTTILVVVLIFFGALMLVPYIESDFNPKYDEDQFTINLVLPQGSTIERTLETCKLIEGYLDKIPEKKSYLTRIGINGVENAKITFDLISLKERKRKDVEIMDELTRFIATIPDVEVSYDRGISAEAGTGDVAIDLYGIDYDTMIKLSQQVKDLMQKSGYFRSVILSYKYPRNEIRLKPLQEKLVEYGVNAASAGSVFRSSVYGEDSNTYKEKGEEYKINIELNDTYAQDFDDIKVMSMLSRKGLIPLDELGKLTIEKAIPTIRHRDRMRVIHLDGFLGKSSLGIITGILDKQFKAIQFPAGYGYRYVGNSEHMSETNQELGKAFMLAIILTFMLLCALMDSLVAYPWAVMTTVGTSVAGMILGLFFFGQSINVASLMGVIMLVGMVVNNAILLLDYTLIKMKEGIPVKEALWLGASEKFRAIMMISLAIILGVLPQLWSVMEAKKSMGAVMTGGMLASIIFTFVFVPVVFWYLVRFEKWFIFKKQLSN
ncbi:MAG: efflux RND transporter permease subunit [Candidatus Omnitrophica bacterium]|jgi:HAE1 family hydrophobic/amphiphilic exporter-1|nr:efflux RND transporter permease subunit [Candidatus Omnitrophota bacterium]